MCRGRGCWRNTLRSELQRIGGENDTHRASAQRIDGFRCALLILRGSFRLAENMAASTLLFALPLLTPCGMIAPKIQSRRQCGA